MTVGIEKENNRRLTKSTYQTIMMSTDNTVRQQFAHFDWIVCGIVAEYASLLAISTVHSFFSRSLQQRDDTGKPKRITTNSLLPQRVH